MKYAFEKVVNENKWQVRLKGFFVCYVYKLKNGTYVDETNTLYSTNRSYIADRVLNEMGYKTRDQFFHEMIEQLQDKLHVHEQKEYVLNFYEENI